MVMVPKKGDAMAEHFKDDEGLFLIPDEIDELDEPSDELLEAMSDALGDTSDLSAARDAIPAPDVPKYLLPNTVYDVIKWVGLILCYALAILTRKVGVTWHIDVAGQVADTIEAIGLFIGMCIGASQISSMGR